MIQKWPFCRNLEHQLRSFYIPAGSSTVVEIEFSFFDHHLVHNFPICCDTMLSREVNCYLPLLPAMRYSTPWWKQNFQPANDCLVLYKTKNTRTKTTNQATLTFQLLMVNSKVWKQLTLQHLLLHSELEKAP